MRSALTFQLCSADHFGPPGWPACPPDGSLPLQPWTVTIDGMVEKEVTLDADQLIRRMPLEERLYRHRCVEAWSMAVPWSGFPLSALVEFARGLTELGVELKSYAGKIDGDSESKVAAIETCIADGANMFSFVCSSYTLAGILKQYQIVLPADRNQFVHFSHASTHVDRHDAFCFGGNCISNRLWVQRKCFVDIYQYRHRSNT